MGKGDRKTRRGKISMGTFGVRRPKERPAAIIAEPVKKEPVAKVEKPKAAAPKKKTAKK